MRTIVASYEPTGTQRNSSSCRLKESWISGRSVAEIYYKEYLRQEFEGGESAPCCSIKDFSEQKVFYGAYFYLESLKERTSRLKHYLLCSGRPLIEVTTNLAEIDTYSLRATKSWVSGFGKIFFGLSLADFQAKRVHVVWSGLHRVDKPEPRYQPLDVLHEEVHCPWCKSPRDWHKTLRDLREYIATSEIHLELTGSFSDLGSFEESLLGALKDSELRYRREAL